MARLYSMTSAGSVDDPEYGHFDLQDGSTDIQDDGTKKVRLDHGGFDLPDDLSDRLHGFWPGGRRAWETEPERNQRLHGDEQARRRDPETLYNAVAEIAGVAKLLGEMRQNQPAPAGPDPAAAPDEAAAPAPAKAGTTAKTSAAAKTPAKTTAAK